MRLAYALTATDMRMRENDVILGIPKSSYIRKHHWAEVKDIEFDRKVWSAYSLQVKKYI